MARPLEFDPEKALAAIKAAFWRLGYEGASLQAIEAATGLNKQSLYRVFGDKRRMYLAALDHYGKTEVAAAAAHLAGEGSARDRFGRLFGDVVAKADRRGCFICNASADQAAQDAQSQLEVSGLIETVHGAFSEALCVSAPYDADADLCAARADMLMTAYFGIHVLVRAGAPQERLENAARLALETI